MQARARSLSCREGEGLPAEADEHVGVADRRLDACGVHVGEPGGRVVEALAHVVVGDRAGVDLRPGNAGRGRDPHERHLLAVVVPDVGHVASVSSGTNRMSPWPRSAKPRSRSIRGPRSRRPAGSRSCHTWAGAWTWSSGDTINGVAVIPSSSRGSSERVTQIILCSLFAAKRPRSVAGAPVASRYLEGVATARRDIEVPGPTSDRYEAIAEAARLCFEQWGVQRTRMDDIAKRAGVPRPALYRYFASKDALVMEVMVRHIRAAGGTAPPQGPAEGPGRPADPEGVADGHRRATRRPRLGVGARLRRRARHRAAGGRVRGGVRRHPRLLAALPRVRHATGASSATASTSTRRCGG